MIYQKYVSSWDNLDVEAYLSCYHDDYKMTFHSTGKVVTLQDLSYKIGSWMVAGKSENRRLIYENEDILVTHNIAFFFVGAGKQYYSLSLKKMGFYGAKKLVQHPSQQRYKPIQHGTKNSDST